LTLPVGYGIGMTVAVETGTTVKVVYFVKVECLVLVLVFSMLKLVEPSGEEVGTGVPGIVGLNVGVSVAVTGQTVV